VIQKDASTVPIPSDSITLLEMVAKPKTFTKGVLTSDIIVLDLMSGTDPAEAETIIKILRQPLHESSGSKPQTLVIISSAMVWMQTP
jgi:hypothetical protein